MICDRISMKVLKMLKYNYHTHTKRCGHAVGEDEEYVIAAIKAGYKILGFSDHGPYKNYSIPSIHMDWDQIDDYISSMRYLKEKYKDQITIYYGFEYEHIPSLIEERLYLKDKVDYMILGQHFIDPTNKYNFYQHLTDSQIIEYAESVCEALDTGLYTYVCHPEVFLYNQEGFNEACEKASRMIIEKAIHTDTPLEINIHGILLRGRVNFTNGYYYIYPHRDFWKLVSEYNAKCVVGIDAHNPKELLDMDTLNKALKEVEDLNLNILDNVILK